MGHPGTYHFRPLIEEVSNGVFEAGGKPGVFYASDICDGVAQAHRDELLPRLPGHPGATDRGARPGPPPRWDGAHLGQRQVGPAHLMAIARCDLPAIHVPGAQLNAPQVTTSDQMVWGLGAV